MTKLPLDKPLSISYNATGCNDQERMMMAKTVQTIEDIARLANVSKSTVSRALNDSPLINQETRERIQSLAREYNFRINAPARNLSMRQSHTLGFVSYACSGKNFSAENMFGLELLGGVSDGLRPLGYDLLVVPVEPHDTTWAHQYLNSGRVDGFVLTISTRKQKMINELVNMGIPFILWGFPQPNSSFCTVCGDDVTGGRIATEYLIRTGRQHIGFLGGPMDEIEVKYRHHGYELALQNAGRYLDPDLVVYGDYSHTSGITAMKRLLEQKPDLDAVFVNSDVMALGAIQYIQSCGKRVPEDIAVVGYDDLLLARYNNLPITTIRQNIPLAGKLLAENLIQYIQTGVVTNVNLPVELVIRKTA
ncbi:LacI family DNA-binding transcriptional regulator [Leptolinea tardivitalis]|nr:LacI family DNA-binding transcriptional regulator [Leptolinea tardivitalis]GAP20427.1 transcriptional regulator, LacI family [Leptolinea tardivitalis]